MPIGLRQFVNIFIVGDFTRVNSAFTIADENNYGKIVMSLPAYLEFPDRYFTVLVHEVGHSIMLQDKKEIFRKFKLVAERDKLKNSGKDKDRLERGTSEDDMLEEIYAEEFVNYVLHKTTESPYLKDYFNNKLYTTSFFKSLLERYGIFEKEWKKCSIAKNMVGNEPPKTDNQPLFILV